MDVKRLHMYYTVKRTLHTCVLTPIHVMHEQKILHNGIATYDLYVDTEVSMCVCVCVSTYDICVDMEVRYI
jgi:hypothetical protein